MRIRWTPLRIAVAVWAFFTGIPAIVLFSVNGWPTNPWIWAGLALISAEFIGCIYWIDKGGRWPRWFVRLLEPKAGSRAGLVAGLLVVAGIAWYAYNEASWRVGLLAVFFLVFVLRDYFHGPEPPNPHFDGLLERGNEARKKKRARRKRQADLFDEGK